MGQQVHGPLRGFLLVKSVQGGIWREMGQTMLTRRNCLHSLLGCNARRDFWVGICLLSFQIQGLGASQSITRQMKTSVNSHTQKSEFIKFVIRPVITNQITPFMFSFVPILWTIFSSSREIILPTYYLV